MAGDVEYFIEEGVRRAVALRELGVVSVPATLHVEGQPGRDLMIPLAALHSPKAEVICDARYRKIAQMNSTPLGRSWLLKKARIQVQILGADPRQGATVPFQEVRLIPGP